MSIAFQNGVNKAKREIENVIERRETYYPINDSSAGIKWSKLNQIERKELLRKCAPSGDWDFYASSGSWGSLPGGVRGRLEKFLK